MSSTLLGHEVVGSGPRRLIVMNDWLCDTSTWQGARPFFDQTGFSWALVDLRGYGRSRGRSGSFTVLEAAADVLQVADALGWQRFSIVGHSMSTYVALHLAQHAVDRVERVVLITPPPPRGFGMDEAWVASSQAAARDDGRRVEMVRGRFAERLSRGWGAYKCERWLATCDAEAAAGYIPVYARDGLPAPDKTVSLPVLAITGEEDAPPMRKEAVASNLSRLCTALEVVSLLQCGHYPMQEMPPRTVSLVEHFCAG